MKLNIFDTWKPLPIHFSRKLEYQTRKAGAGNVFNTSVRDVATKAILFKTFGMSPESSEKKVPAVLGNISAMDVESAIKNGIPIKYNSDIDNPKLRPQSDEIQWRDGANQSHSRFQNKTGRGEVRVQEADEKKKKLRNFVAKNSRVTANSAGPMKDKTAFKRREKHVKKNDHER